MSVLFAWAALLAAPVTTAAGVRGLTPAEANRRSPVDITGVVTLSHPTKLRVFVQDDTGGVYLQTDALPAAGLRPGTKVRVTGHTTAGWFAPYVVPDAVVPLGPAALPVPFGFNLSQNEARWLDGQYVLTYALVRGPVRVAGPNGALTVGVEGAGGRGAVWFHEPPAAADLEALVGSVVRVRGVCVPDFTPKGQITGDMRVYAQSAADMAVVEPAARVAAAPVRTAEYLRRFLPGASPLQLVRMSGVVTAAPAAGVVLVQDETGGFAVRLPAGGFAPAAGTRVDVTGFFALAAGRITVRGATVEARGPAPLPPPRDVPAAPDLPAADGCRVRFQGRVTEVDADGFVLAAGGTTAAVRTPPGGPAVDVGALLTVIGALEAGDDRAAGLLIHTAAPADVTVDAAPDRPWVTPGQAVALGGLVAAGLAATVGWAVALRRAVGARTAALRDSEAKFETVFRNSPDAFVLSRAADGVIIEVNDRFAALTGFTREAAIGRSSVELAWAEPARRKEMLAVIRAGGRVRDYPARLLGADGAARDVLLAAEPITVGGEACLLGVIRDVTEQVKAERAARAERAFTDTMIESMPGVLYFYDQAGKFLRWNRTFETVTGYTAAEIAGMHPLDFFAAPDQPLLADRMRGVFETGEGFAEAPFRAKDGTTTPYFFTGRRVEVGGAPCLVGIGIDVSAARRAEQALAASERKFSAIFRLSPIPLTLARLDGVFVDVSQSFEKLYRIPPRAAVGRRASDFPELYDSPAERAPLIDRLMRDGRLAGVERRRVLPDGTVVETAASAELIELDGETFVLGAVADVGPLKRAQAALREANATLEQRVADRTAELAAANAELEAFCYAVSHDLRAPLRAMDGFSQAVLEDYAAALDEHGADYLRRIRAAARRMGELIDDLLGLSRVGRGELRREPVDLSALAAEVVAGLRDADPGRDVAVTIAPGLTAHADKALMRVVLDNLIGNAWKYTGKTAGARIEVDREPAPDRPWFVVRDNGAGFDPKYAPKLFQPFQRLHRADEFPGHGVGLATVLRVVRRHGGAVAADGARGGGATFRFSIP